MGLIAESSISTLINLINKSVKTKGVYDKYFVTKRDEPPARNTKEWLKYYNTSPRLSPVTKIAKDIATTRGQVISVQKNGVEKVISDYPLLDLLYKPNEQYNITGTASLYLSQVYFLLKGEAFGVIERDLLGQPKFVWFVPPSWVTVPSEGKKHYTVSLSNGEKLPVKVEDMFYRKNPNPLDPLGRGVGAVESLGDEIETDEYMAKFAKRFFYNDATPNLIITAPEDADDDEIKKAERKWYQKFGGLVNSSKAAFLNWDAHVHVLNTSNREMDFIESRKFYRDLVIQHFGIPPEIMGNVENSNKATVVAARDIYRNEVLNTMFIEFEEAITYQILRQFTNSEKLKFVFTRAEEDKSEFTLKILDSSLSAGTITLSEYRRGISNLLGYDLDELSEEYKDSLVLPSQSILIDIKKPYAEQVEAAKEPITDSSDGNSEGGKEDE